MKKLPFCILISILFIASTNGVYAQFNMDNLNKLKEAANAKDKDAVMDTVNSLKDSKGKKDGASTQSQLEELADKTGKKDGKPSPLDKANALKEATSKNEKKKDDFTGGEKMGVAQAILELKADPNPEAKKILLIQGGMDTQYTVFNGNKEFAIFRMKNLPPSETNTQFAVKKSLEKEVKQMYKKGSKFESGYYEIVGTKVFREFTFDETPVVIIQKVELKLF
jgi:hypothetical protein